MESTNDNSNQIFLSKFKELRKEFSTVKKRIVQLEESHLKQQERINILERENKALKMKKGLNIKRNEEVRSVSKRKRTVKDQDQDQDQDQDEETESKSTSDSSCKKSKTNNNNNNNDDDNGDSFDSLSDDLLHKIVEFDGNCYKKFGLINKRCKNIYDMKEYKLKKQTCLYGYGTVDMMLEHYLQKRREGSLDEDLKSNTVKAVFWYNRLDAIDWIIQLGLGDIELLELVCWFAAWNGRINILSRVFLKCNLTMLDHILDDTSMCDAAANFGKLETLKWLRKYGAKWDARTFAYARENGHDEIVEYLRTEGCPEPPKDTDESSENEQLGSDDIDSYY